MRIVVLVLLTVGVYAAYCCTPASRRKDFKGYNSNTILLYSQYQQSADVFRHQTYTFSPFSAKFIKCYECDPEQDKQCGNDANWGTLRTCNEWQACGKFVAKGK